MRSNLNVFMGQQSCALICFSPQVLKSCNGGWVTSPTFLQIKWLRHRAVGDLLKVKGHISFLTCSILLKEVYHIYKYQCEISYNSVIFCFTVSIRNSSCIVCDFGHTNDSACAANSIFCKHMEEPLERFWFGSNEWLIRVRDCNVRGLLLLITARAVCLWNKASVYVHSQPSLSFHCVHIPNITYSITVHCSTHWQNKPLGRMLVSFMPIQPHWSLVKRYK